MFPSPGGDVLHQDDDSYCLICCGFRPLTGLCCVGLYAPIIIQGGFPSPGGVVLRHGMPESVFIQNAFPSPSGDVLRLRHHRDAGGAGSFRPLAGMCCVYLSYCFDKEQLRFRPLAGLCCVFLLPWLTGISTSFRPLAGLCCVKSVGYSAEQASGFPSPGGVVLRPVKPILFPSTATVSVPWRGCVASLAAYEAEQIRRKFPSPGGVVLRRLGLSDFRRWQQRVSVPWRGCVASQETYKFFPVKKSGFRPLAGLCCVVRAKYIRFLAEGFRPLAGLCCVGKFAQNDLLKKKLFMIFAFFCNIL